MAATPTRAVLCLLKTVSKTLQFWLRLSRVPPFILQSGEVLYFRAMAHHMWSPRVRGRVPKERPKVSTIKGTV